MTIPFMPEMGNPRQNASGIPVIPGPFAFLQGLGQAAGGYAVTRDFLQQRDRQQAQDSATRALELRKLGLLDPSAFGTPEMIKMFRIAGMTPPSTEATPDEQIAGIKRRVLGAVNSGRGLNATREFDIEANPVLGWMAEKMQLPEFTDEELMIAGMPRSGIGAERVQQATTGAQQQAISQGGAAGRQVTGVPSEAVAASAEGADIQKNTEQTADGYIAQQLRGLDVGQVANNSELFDATVDAAYQRYQADSSQGLVPKLPDATARQIFARALQRKIDIDYGLETGRIKAARAGQGRSGNPVKDLSAIYEARIRGRTAQIESKRKQFETLQKGLSNIAQFAPTESDKATIQKMATLQQEIDALDSYQAEDNSSLQSIMTQTSAETGMGTPQSGVTGGRQEAEINSQREAWDNAVRNANSSPTAQIKGKPRKKGESGEAYITRVKGKRP